MKFSNDRKSSMFIYPSENVKGFHCKMEISLKKELEATKSALKLQTMRCRQLVTAFTRKLHEKEMELRASKDLRDQQLSRLLRALLVLESRLKKEQKLIRQQLAERDFIIEKQEKEISKYKSETNAQWTNMGTSDAETKNGRSEPLRPLPTTGEERLDNLCKGLMRNSQTFYLRKVESDINSDVTNDHEIKNLDNNIVKEENTFRDNPVLESVNQILLKDEDELLETVKPVRIDLKEKDCGTESRGETTEWYETNSNTIADEQVIASAWCLSVEGEEPKGRKDVWSPDKTSPIKSQHLEEKACLEMSKKNLTIVNLEEIDSKTMDENRAASPVKSTASYEEIIPVTKTTKEKPAAAATAAGRNLQKPPALPPKPARLLKPHQILQQQNCNSRLQSTAVTDQAAELQVKSHLEPKGDNHVPRVPAVQATANNTNKPPPNKKPMANHSNQTSTSTRQSHVGGEVKSMKPTSEGGKTRPKPADSSTKLKKNQTSNGHVPNSLDNSANCVPTFVAKQKKVEDLVGNCAAIKIGSSVSSLITGLSRETIVTELNGDQMNLLPPDETHVSQLVRQFEVLGKYDHRAETEANDIRRNFEEFKLEESYEEAEDGRHDGDGAENKNNMVNYYATLTIVPPATPKDSLPTGNELEYKMYETFLENTGLSQKSILTPSRMLSNHRSCLKPKDVKHRNRVKAAAAIEKCNVNVSNGGPTVKYWTEPFL